MPRQPLKTPARPDPTHEPASAANRRGPVARAALGLIRLQTARPVAMLSIALCTLIFAAFAASRLTLRTSFAELLPQNKESVVVANALGERLAAASVLTVIARGEDAEGLKRFVDALAPELRAIGPDLVGSVDDGVRVPRAFFEKNRLLYAPLSEVREARDAIVERYDYEVSRATGAYLDLDGSEPPPPITAASIRERAAKHEDKQADRFPDGYYLEPAGLDHPGGRLITILVYTAVPSGDLDRSRALRARVEETIARVGPARFDPTMRVDLGGDFIESLEENDQVKTDLGHVGLTGVLLIFAVVFCFYLRLRTLAAMGLTVGIGVLWTFGLAEVLVGHLNASTGFLVSIVAGNGINFGILYMARYLEARRTAGVAASVGTAHAETWAGTLAAAGSAMVAYGSLIATDCRAFRHFGIIGGSGMVLCWLATYLFLPPILALSERLSPMRPDAGIAARLRGAYGRPFALVAERFPRAIVLGSAAITLISTGLAAHYIASDPMEYDLRNTRMEAELSVARQLEPRVAAVIGRGGLDGVALLVDRVDQALPLKAALEAKRDAAPEGKKPFGQVVTLFDFIPADQEEKLAALGDVRDRLERAHRRGLIAERDWVEIDAAIPPASTRPIGAADLPEAIARPFTEKDGTRGRVAYVAPAPDRTLGDAIYLMEWADSLRRTTLADGTVVKGSGRSVIFADLILAVLEDAPRMITISLGLTALIIVLAFRGRRAAWIALGTLLVGVAWMLAFMALYEAKIRTGALGLPTLELSGMKLNFLNFVALPISIGVGADYALNIVQRHRLAGPAELRRVIVETGGAVILCSLTTTLGYVALTLSANKAIRSFGVAAAAGEVTCLLAAVLVLPAWLFWRRQRSAAAALAAARPSAPEGPGQVSCLGGDPLVPST